MAKSALQCIGMDTNQTRIIELLREAHLIAFKEMERLNLRIIELENQNRQSIESPIVTVSHPPVVNPPSESKKAEMLTDMQVAE